MQICKDVDVSFGGMSSKVLYFHLKSLFEAWHKRSTTSQHDVVIQVNFEITVAHLNRSVRHFNYAVSWIFDYLRVEKDFT